MVCSASSFHKLSVPPSYVIPVWCVFSKPCTNITLHCNHKSGHLKTEHAESLLLLRRHLGNGPRGKHEKRTAGSTCETWTVAAADGVRCARVRWEINFLLNFETAPFFCVYPVFRSNRQETGGHRKLHKVELYKLCLPNIIQVIKLKGIWWAGDVLHIGARGNA